MCGICGVYDFQRGAPVDPGLIARMTDVIQHRGPDDDGAFFDCGAALGFRRLSIIDPAGGHQPMLNEDGAVALTFNGEIYNFQELRAALRSRGHRFRTQADTEVVVHLYEDRGDDCLDDLRGMFALALWDAAGRRLLLARDRLGIKPLYYTVQDGQLIFASEIKAILQHPAVAPRLDMQGLSDFLSLKFVPGPRTMFAGISALPPGHLLTCDGDGPRVRQYWDVSFAGERGPHLSEADYVEELGALLREAIRMHLVSDVPFGAFLSGGLDSSTVVALMSEFLDQPVKTFSVAYEGSGAAFSEAEYARAVARHYGTEHREVILTAEEFVAQAERVIWHLDQPIADEASVANFTVAELAARHVKMVLTGEGGDELFAGYARYSGERFAPLLRHLPAAASGLAVDAAGRLPGLRGPKLALNALVRREEADRLANWFPLFRPGWKARLLRPELSAEIPSLDASPVVGAQLAQTDARLPVNRMLYVDTKLWLVDDLLARGDKTSMAASIEARVPLLDHKLVEFAARLPVDLKIHRMTRKYLLRRVAAPLLPPEVVQRRKRGFAIPTSVWFREEAREWVRDLLAPMTLHRRGLFRPAFVQRLLDEHERGFADHGQLIWGLLAVELWHRQFLDGGGPAAIDFGAPRVGSVTHA